MLTITPLFSEVCTPAPFDPSYVYINPFIRNTHQLTFDLTAPYYFWRAVSKSSRELINYI
jgi:hypothetical protein